MKKCKVCNKEFQQTQPLQTVCSMECAIEYAERRREEKWRKEKKEKLPELYPRKYRGYLQQEINKLAKMIDFAVGNTTCIDCGQTLIGIKQIDAAHYHNVKGHENIRYNLHNIHSARSNCNYYSDTHKQGYEIGIAERYSKEYLEEIKGLDTNYKNVQLTNKEVAEKLKLARKIIRDFSKYDLSNLNGRTARDLFNKIIGIY